METFKLTGLDDVLRKMKQLSDRGARNASRRALRKGANVIRDAAKRNAQRIDDPVTRENISKNIVSQNAGIKRERRAGGPMVRVGVLGGASSNQYSDDATGNPGGDTRHWRYLEFGTSDMKKAYPFMRPAMIENAGKAFAAIAQALDHELGKELAKLK